MPELYGELALKPEKREKNERIISEHVVFIRAFALWM
jgi:hypothetical protein